MANTSPYLTIDTCDPSVTAKVTTKLNDNILAIWNAQDKLVDRSPTNRTIKIGLGDTSTADGKEGKVSSSTCTGSAPYSGFCSFTTDLASTLRPFWNFTSTCSSGDTTRWCAVTGDCNYCSDSTGSAATNAALSDRSCTTGTVTTDCSYCSTSQSTTCTNSTTTGGCYLPDYGTCSGNGTSTSNGCSDTGAACTSDTDCGAGKTCNGYCTLNGTLACTGDIGCTVNKGPCVTTNLVCNTGISCSADCDENCAKSVIKFAQGYDKPSYSGSGSTSPGSSYRARQQCTADADCPGGTCSSGECSAASYDVIKTLKLGDIVYSTPRISPNSAVNGYDVTYKDSTYKNFVGSATVKNATPIVIVGANDGMVHAFQVSKIKDLSPVSETSGSDTTTTADGSYQTARFSDYPPTSDSAPPSDIGKELWAYIPYNAVPYLKWYCEESYCHIPMVDARFTVVDASVDYNKNGFGAGSGSATDVRTCNTNGTDCVWRRLLVGAMGIGEGR